MTARTVPEWLGKSPDAAIPPRVRVRLFERAGGCCQLCSRKLHPGDKWDADHIVALVNNGEHRESNLQVACSWCHRTKTASDVAEKARTYRKRAKHVGVKRVKPLSKFKRKLDGTVVLRETGEPVR